MFVLIRYNRVNGRMSAIGPFNTSAEAIIWAIENKTNDYKVVELLTP